MHTVSILGLGAMGSRMAHTLLDAGHTVTVYNRSDAPAHALTDAGATRAATPREAAAASEIVISMVTDDEASRAVWLGDNGAVLGLADDAIAIESSTLTPNWARELGAAVQEQRAAFLDAPVLGTRPQAASGSLIYLVGGPDAALDRVRPLLNVMGDAVHRVGEAGAGMTMKLAVNALFGVQVAAVAELLGFLDASGLDVAASADLLSTFPVMSPAARRLMGRMVEGDDDPLFPVDLVEKDFRYVRDAADAAGASVPTADAVRAVYARAQEQGFGAENMSAVAKLFFDEATYVD